MAPIPFASSALAKSEWQKKLATINGDSSNPRKAEFTAEKTKIIQNATNKPTLKYRELKLDSQSKAYGQIVQNLNGWKNEWGEKPALDDLTSLKFTVDASRATPVPGDDNGYPLYIAMHGGGGPVWIENLKRDETLAESADSNDEQWYEMTTLYTGAVKRGVWVATRGIGNSWDMHFTPAGYVLMERLIEDLVLFQGVDANQVYLIGFSAGGDGVYRLSTRLSQRFAAVNMGGGDPGDVQFANLINTPICLQIGEQDRSNFDRCKNVAISGVALDQLHQQYPSGYVHDLFIHPTAPVPTGEDAYVWKHYSGWETVNGSWPSPDTPRQPAQIVKNYTTWIQSFPSLAPSDNLTSANTNAIDWVNSHNARPSTPQNVIWNLAEYNDSFSAAIFQNTAGRSGDGSGRSQNYWLDIGPYSRADVGDRIEARIEKSSNTVVVVSAKKYLRILLRADMLDLSKMVNVRTPSNDTLTVHPKTDNVTVIQDTLIRNDPNLIFTSDVILTQGADLKWSAATS